MSDGDEEDYHLPLSSHPTFDFSPQDIAAEASHWKIVLQRYFEEKTFRSKNDGIPPVLGIA